MISNGESDGRSKRKVPQSLRPLRRIYFLDSLKEIKKNYFYKTESDI
jgi:hypothetical protein